MPVCQRTRNFKKFNGSENCTAMLKQWIYDGFQDDITNKDRHNGIANKSMPVDRLTDAELEAWEPPVHMLSGAAMRRNKLLDQKRQASVEAAGPKAKAKNS